MTVAHSAISEPALTDAIVDILDDAGLSVSSQVMPKMVALQLGRYVPADEIEVALAALHRDRVVMKCGVRRGFQTWALA